MRNFNTHDKEFYNSKTFGIHKEYTRDKIYNNRIIHGQVDKILNKLFKRTSIYREYILVNENYR
jgi:hypothetical protein